MGRRIAAMLAALALGMIGVGSVSGAGPTAIAAGSFTYHPFGGPASRSGSIAAVATPGIRGAWSWQDRRGPITCFVIDGSDAWLAGPGTTGPDTGVLIHVRDGGHPGTADDKATAFGQDPGQPLEELIGWCEDRTMDIPLFPIDSGDVTVRELP